MSGFNKKINILVITPFFYPFHGGTDLYLEGLYRNLYSQNGNIKVDVLCYNTHQSLSYEKYACFEIFRIPCINILPKQYAIPFYPNILMFLFRQKSKYNLIHADTRFFESSWWAPIYAKIINTKIILTDHCTNHPIHKSKLITLISKTIDLTLASFFLNFYDKIFVVSNQTQEFLLRVYKKECTVLYAGADSKKFYPLKKNNKKIQISYVGRLIETKGILHILEVSKNFPNARFNIAGEGPMETKIAQIIHTNNLKNINFLGKISHDKVAKLLQRSDIFIYPSYHSEGLPLGLIEAGACGLAVIATNVGAIKELITNNVSGILIKPRDSKSLKKALTTLINNKDFRKKLSTNIILHIKNNFSWKKSINKFQATIQPLLS